MMDVVQSIAYARQFGLCTEIEAHDLFIRVFDDYFMDGYTAHNHEDEDLN